MSHKEYLTWVDAQQLSFQITVRIKAVLPINSPARPIRIYGVPRGGVPVALMVKEHFNRTFNDYAPMEICDRAGDADVIVDDIIDSGTTKRRLYEAWCRECSRDDIILAPQGIEYFPFFALIDKIENPADKAWWVFPWEIDEGGSIQDSVTRMLQFIGEDVNRDGLKETPDRVVKSWKTIFGGYSQDAKSMFKTFEDDCDEMVVLKDIEFYSTCEHHLQPFFGKAHIAYIPDGKVIGVSKLARVLEVYARRLQIQERICRQVTDDLMKYLEPKGAACVLEAKHFCMVCRGVHKQNSTMITSSLQGVFREPEVRSEFMSMIK